MPTQRSHYVIAYDIPDDKRRLKVARALQGHGERVQYSVFECQLTGKQFAALWRELRELAQPQADSLRAYRLCPACAGWVKTAGRAARVAEIPDVYIV
jgi:CRISPR-associated protein Cas2